MGLNVLQISESDLGGGAGLTATRIHLGLSGLGHRPRMLVGRKLGSDPDVRVLKRGPGWRAADALGTKLLDPAGLQYVFYPSSFGVARDPWFREADVVQLHNTHGSYFSHTALPALSRRRPLVWFLHDQWALTGHVAYSFDCERWRTGCGSCPYLHEYPALPRDTTRLLFRVKAAVYRHSRITLVSPSRWLARLAGESPLLSRFPVRVVPNGVDLARFRPGDRRELKRELGLDPERPLLLWVTADPNDRRKGAHLIEEIRGRVGRDHQFLAVGGGLSEAETARRYAAADVYLLPSLADNLPNTAVESIASGTPVAAFDVGGVSDVVRHLETGWLAPPGDTAALATGVRSLLDDEELRERLGARARETAENEFSIELQVRRLIDLYEEVLAA